MLRLLLLPLLFLFSVSSAREKFTLTYAQWKKEPGLLEKQLALERPVGKNELEIAKSEDGTSFWYNAKGFAIGYIQLGNPRALNRELIKPMTATGYDIDLFWIVAPATLNHTRVSVESPIIHYTAEVPSDRLPFLKALGQYYTDVRKRPDIFGDMLNARNSDGLTLLDYIIFLKESGKVLPAQKEAMEELREFVILNGGRRGK